MNQHKLARYICWIPLLLLLLSQPLLAQTSLPTCTAEIADVDGDQTNDNDGADGIIDIDKDGDGLIEICDLEGLNEIRYQLNGSGYKASSDATKITQGCPAIGCRGYELVKNLDFNADTSYRTTSNKVTWTMGNGWSPIGSFSSVFEGNGHVIFNLQINRVGDNNVGLFAVLDLTGRIENVELIYPNIRGRSNVGALVGNNNGVVINSYVQDYDTTVDTSDLIRYIEAVTRDTTKYIEAIEGSVGGLVGRNNGGGANIGHIINSGAVINVQIKENTSAGGIGANAGGLTGFNLNGAEIRNSYARGTVKGPCGVGGLTANNHSTVQSDPEKNSKIINSYATGNVTTGFGTCDRDINIRSGGLAAVNSGLISNSYTTSCFSSGTVTVANTRRGGVVQNNSGTISNSYYQTTGCDNLQETPSGSAYNQVELRSPDSSDNTFYEGIYQAWLPNEWDFGDDEQYPYIRYTVGPDKDNPGCGYPDLPACDAMLKNQIQNVLTESRTETPDTQKMGINMNWANTSNDVSLESYTFPTYPGGSIVIGDTNFSADIFSDRPTHAQLKMAHSSSTDTQIYNFNFIPVLIIPDSPTPPSQPNAGNNLISVCCEITAYLNQLRTYIQYAKLVPAFPDSAFNYDVYIQSDYAEGTKPRLNFSLEFIANNILTEISGSPGKTDFILQPSEFNLTNKRYKLYVQNDQRQDNLVIQLTLGSSYSPTNCSDVSSNVTLQLFSCRNPIELIIRGNRYNSETIEFNIEDTTNNPATSYGPFSLEVIPTIAASFASLAVNSEIKKVNSKIENSPATLTDDGVMLVKLGDTVGVNAEGSFIVENGVSRPLNYDWHIRSGPTLFSGELRGKTISFNINDNLFRNSQSGDAVLTLALRDKYNPATTPVTKQIPIRILDRLVLTSSFGEVMQDQAASTPHRVVLAPNQPQTVITARSLNAAITLTVDDSATNITAVNGGGTSTSSMITLQVDEGSETEFTITATDSDGTTVTHTVWVFRHSGVVSSPMDDDNDGLIDIYTLEDLDEIRNQYTNMPNICGSNNALACEGFELRRSLDFNAADSYQDKTINTAWTTGLGWRGISGTSPFNKVFEGNGFTISGLYIDRPSDDSVGLFSALGTIGTSSVIKNVGLLDVSIRGGSSVGSLVGENRSGCAIVNSYVTTATIVGNQRIGGLVGESRGAIINSYVTTATIVGDSEIGGLAGYNGGDIISSFAYADVIGSTGDMGGLVGNNKGEGKIINTYAAGTVSSTQTVVNVGGLAGVHVSNSESAIRNSYTISRVRPLTGSSQVGGLVGDHQISNQNSIAASYWDKTVNTDLTTSDGDGARTTAELQNPTAPGATSADTYYGWRTDAWDFGDRIHYPTLYYATTDSTVSACADSTTPSSALPRCGSRLPNQAVRNLIPDLPDLEVSEITINAQPAANADGTINEGSNVSLMVNATGGSESYSYTWSQTSGRTLELENSTSTILSFTIPPDLVELDATTAAITFQVEVNDGSLTIRRSAIITIQKIDNGSFSSANADITPTQLRIIPTGTDPDGAGVFSYQWQQQELGGEWEDINDATMATYSLPTDVSASVHYRVTISYTDGQGYTTDYIQGPFKATFDDDNDRLIDIYTLEDLDEIRNQYRNMPTRCGSSGDIACNGFELRRSLDFNAAESYQSGMIDPNWTTSTGWTPIGSAAFNDRFNRVFEGNDFTISGLYINRSQSPNVGLFGVSHSEIKNIGLLDVNIIGRNNVGGLVGWRSSSAIINSYTSGTVSGHNSVGGLAGFNNGSILNSYTNVAVTATVETVGGLVGSNNGSILNSYASGAVSGVSHVGGLSGQNQGRANIINSYATGAVTATNIYIGGLVGSSEVGTHIINSYATGTVNGSSSVGGLVGWHQGELRNAYATGDVLLTSTSDNDLGGLIGDWSGQKNSISNSYAIGRVIPGAGNARNAGGLIGTTTGTAISSYWDSETSEWRMSAGGATSKTTMELQSPTASGATAAEVYYGWGANDWDFGSSEDYPALRYVTGGMNACNADMSTASDLPQCGSLLPNQGRIGQVALAVSEVTVSSQPMANVDGTINEGSNISLMVNATGGSRAYNFAWSQTSGKALVLTTTNTATLNVAIPPDFIAKDAATTMLTFTVMVDDGMSTISRSRMITITKASLTISGVMLSAATIAEGSTATVTFDVSGGTGIYQYGYKLITGADEIALPSLTPPAVLVMPADIVAAADSDRVVELNIIVSDGGGRRVEHNEELTIQKVDNGLANIEASRATSKTLAVKVGSDPDGDATTPNYAYQWQRAAEGTAQWMDISGENDASYTITDDLAETSGEFRVQVIYTDGQGYKETSTSNEISHTPPGSGLRIRTKIFLEGPLR